MKRLLILSGKGGTGKTTTAAAFIHFARAKALADCDVDAPNLHLVLQETGEPAVTDFFGGEKAVIDPAKCIGCGICQEHCRFHALEKADDTYRVNEYACEGCGVCAYVCPQHAIELVEDLAGRKELYLGDGVFSTAALKMGRGNSGKLVNDVKMAMLKHAPDTPLAIIDGSPGIGCPVIASVSGMDLVLVVAEPSRSGISDLQRLIRTAETFQTRLAVCVNKWDVSPENTQAIETFCERENIPFAGKIPYDKSASRAINEGLSIADIDCPARDALKDIFNTTSKLLGL
ncbi:MAG: 4Fe-4S binding protein [Lachnospiraceae bacterium]|nr:4Fe-4S binding protein [Lachnospiraceae bacterium]MDY4970974.1 4Fe-4S binding protein [Lachnospiraceae bacterium]